MLSKFKKFSDDVSGNIAIFTAIGLMPLLALLAGAHEYSQFTKIRANVQNAADNAVLAAFQNPKEKWVNRVSRINGLFEANLIYKSNMKFAKAKLEVSGSKKKTILTYTVSSGLNSMFGNISPFYANKFRVKSRAIFDPKSGKPPRLVPFSDTTTPSYATGA